MKENNRKGSEWFEISPDDWLDTRFKHKKLRLLSDSQVPKPVIEEIRQAKISIEELENKMKERSDEDILEFANKKGYVLLTLDKDFWDDRKFPLHKVKGIIYVSVNPNNHFRILRAFGLVYGCFAKEYPFDWWHEMKIKTTDSEFVIKMRNYEGRVLKYKMKLKRGYLVAKEWS